MDANTLAFTIGQYPNHCKNGEVYQLGQGFRYKNNEGKVAVAKLIFHIYIGGVPAGIQTLPLTPPSMEGSIYNLNGQRVSVNSVFSAPSVLPKGVYIVDGKKVWMK